MSAQPTTNPFERPLFLDDDAEEPMADLSGLRIVLVEDEDDLRELVAFELAECGATVLEAASAEEGLALVEKERPDVLVSDIGLPDHDGYALIRRLRASEGSASHVPAIALTAQADLDASFKALVSGFQVHVAKPAEPRFVAQAVANVVGLPVRLDPCAGSDVPFDGDA